MEKGKQCFVTRQKSLLPIQLILLCTKAKGYFREVIISFVEKKTNEGEIRNPKKRKSSVCLKLVSAIFYQNFIFHQMIAL